MKFRKTDTTNLEGGPLVGIEYTVASRPGSFYRKDEDGLWHIRNKSTGDKFQLISSSERQDNINRLAKPRTTTLRTTLPGANTGLSNAEYERLSSMTSKEYGEYIAGKDKDSGNSVVSDSDLESKFLKDLKNNENGVRKGVKNGRHYAYSSHEGGTDTIGWGHKLTRDEVGTGKIMIGSKSVDYRSGLTDDQANSLFEADYADHKDRARKKVDVKYGKGAFDNLNRSKQLLITDFEYNVGISTFPTLLGGLVNNDKDVVLNEYKRYSKGEELGRNNWTKSFIQDSLVLENNSPGLRKGGILYK